MASRTNAKVEEFVDTVLDVNVSPDVTNHSAIPEFDDGDDVPQHNAVGLSEDDFAGIVTDDARDEKNRATLDPPQGDWLKTEKFEFSSVFMEDDSMPGDLYPAGRLILKFAGYPDVRIANGVDYKPRFFLNLSPDVRYKDKELDLTHKLFLRAKDLFLADKQRKYKDIAELIKFLRFEEYIIRMAKGTDSLYCVGLKSKDTLKGRTIK